MSYKPSSNALPVSAYSKLFEIPDGSARSYVVENLKPYNEFYFRIRAKNQVGVGLPGLSPAQFVCQTRGRSKYRTIKYGSGKCRF